MLNLEFVMSLGTIQKVREGVFEGAQKNLAPKAYKEFAPKAPKWKKAIRNDPKMRASKISAPKPKRGEGGNFLDFQKICSAPPLAYFLTISLPDGEESSV